MLSIGHLAFFSFLPKVGRKQSFQPSSGMKIRFGKRIAHRISVSGCAVLVFLNIPPDLFILTTGFMNTFYLGKMGIFSAANKENLLAKQITPFPEHPLPFGTPKDRRVDS